MRPPAAGSGELLSASVSLNASEADIGTTMQTATIAAARYFI